MVELERLRLMAHIGYLPFGHFLGLNKDYGKIKSNHICFFKELSSVNSTTLNHICQKWGVITFLVTGCQVEPA